MSINQDDIQNNIANDLVKGIIARLYEVFGASYTFYAEDVPQGFKEPSFAVLSMMPIRSAGLGGRKYWEFPFDVHYFTSTGAKRAEWNEVEQKLALELERITACNTSVKATEIQPSTWDDEQGVGHFYVVYGMHLMDMYSEPVKMDSLYHQNGIVAGC